METKKNTTTLKAVQDATRMWWIPLLFGLASVVLGVTALTSRIDALAGLVTVFAISLLYAGAAEIAFAAVTRYRMWTGVLAGVLSIAASVIAVFWPGITLVVLAVLVGASLISWGIYRIYQSVSDPVLRPRIVTLIEGLLLLALGVLALAWPGASVLVLAALVGVFFTVFGVFSVVAGLRLLDVHRAVKKARAEAGSARAKVGRDDLHSSAA
jgi:uncharacterized membrane protein HdeD (DUF308 family)